MAENEKLDAYDEGITQDNVMLIIYRDDQGWLGFSVRNEAAERIQELVRQGIDHDIATNRVFAGILRRKREPRIIVKTYTGA